MRKTSRVPAPRPLRILTLLLGAAMLIWLPFEDTSLLWPIAFSFAIFTLGAARALTLPPPTFRYRWLLYTGAGGLAGLGVTAMALFLMAFKSGIHGHGAPDFTPNQVISVIDRTPLWVIAGILTGTGIAIRRKITAANPRSPREQGDSHSS